MSGFFVPHDLKAPLKGAASGPLAGLTAAVKDMYDIAGETHRRRQSGLACASAKPAAKHAAAVAEAARRRRDHHRQDDLRRVLLQRRRHQRALRHAAEPARAGPHSRRLVERTRRRRPRPAPATSRSAPTPAARCASRPRSAGSTASAPRTAASTPRGAMDMSPSFDTVGWFAQRRGRVPHGRGGAARRRGASRADRTNLLIADDAFAQADEPVAALLRDALERDGRRAAASRSTSRSRRTASIRGATRSASSRRTRSGRSTAASSRRRSRSFGPGVAERMADRVEGHRGARPMRRGTVRAPRASTSAR